MQSRVQQACSEEAPPYTCPTFSQLTEMAEAFAKMKYQDGSRAFVTYAPSGVLASMVHGAFQLMSLPCSMVLRSLLRDSESAHNDG